MTNEAEVIEFPLKKEISGPITMDAEAFKANLAAAYSSGAMMMRERAANCAELYNKDGPDRVSTIARQINIATAIRKLSQSPSGKDT